MEPDREPRSPGEPPQARRERVGRGLRRAVEREVVAGGDHAEIAGRLGVRRDAVDRWAGQLAERVLGALDAGRTPAEVEAQLEVPRRFVLECVDSFAGFCRQRAAELRKEIESLEASADKFEFVASFARAGG